MEHVAFFFQCKKQAQEKKCGIVFNIANQMYLCDHIYFAKIAREWLALSLLYS